MIEVSEAEKIIASQLRDFGTEQIPLSQSLNRVLDQDIVADRDMPPFDRVTMDGIAILFEKFKQGRVTFRIESIQAAGEARKILIDPNGCIEVMTGAILPEGVDTVIRYEDVMISGNTATISAIDINAGQNVHKQASDRERGSIVIPSGRRIGAPEINILASVGCHQINVKSHPNIYIISTGDELVEIDKIPLSHQIRRSNVYSLAAQLNLHGYQCKLTHINDEINQLRHRLHQIMDADLLILSGGVSMGKYDYVPFVLEELGVRKQFHKVKQRPGKPFWFGSASAGPVVFALPGNPVSSAMCMTRYVIPWLRQSAGIPSNFRQAIMTSEVVFKKDLCYFPQVKLVTEGEKLLATPIEGHGSGDLANMVNVDAFAEMPREKSIIRAGELVRVFPFRLGD